MTVGHGRFSWDYTVESILCGAWDFWFLGHYCCSPCSLMMGKTFHLISWQKILLPPGGDFSSPNTWSYHMIFRVSGSRLFTSSVVMWNGHSQDTAPFRKLFPSSPGWCWRLPAVSSIKLPRYTLWLGWNHESCLENEKKNLFPISHAQRLLALHSSSWVL